MSADSSELSGASGPLRCPMDIALDLIGTRSAMALLRAAFGGASRFDDLVATAGVSTMIGAARLHEFLDAGLMVKRPYRSRQRTRHEYQLTELGLQCLPVITALMHLGRTIAPAASAPGLLHAGCGAELAIELHCSADHDIALTSPNHLVADATTEDSVAGRTVHLTGAPKARNLPAS